MALHFLESTMRPCIASPAASEWISTVCKRHQSTFRRTRKALRVKPDSSFAPTKTERQDHIIFNPPSSMPNVYHTPSKFLPANDPRRIVTTASKSSTSSASPKGTATTAAFARPAALPSIVVNEHTKKYNVTKEQVEEIRRLRAEDPVYWTRPRLAQKFNCSSFFINLCAKSDSAGRRHAEQLEAIKAKWGRVRTIAKEAKYERQRLWGRE